MNDLKAQAQRALSKAVLPLFGFSLCLNLLLLTVPVYMLQVFDRVLSSRSTDTLLLLTLIAVIALLAFAALEHVRSHVLIGLGSWLSHAWGPLLLQAVVHRAAVPGGERSGRPIRDLEALRGFLAGPGLLPLLDAPWAPIFMAFVFIIHPLLGWLALAGGIGLFVLAIWNDSATRAGLTGAQRHGTDSQVLADSAARNADMIAAMGLLPALTARWTGHNGAMLQALGGASRRAALIAAAARFLRLLVQILVLGLGAWLVIQQDITAGAMIAASIIMARALQPFEQAIAGWRQWQLARDSYRRLIADLAALPPLPTMPMPTPEGALKAEAVGLRIADSERPILKEIGFVLAPGEALGLIGPSACGKSSLARIIVGSWRPTNGSLRLDGAETCLMAPDDRARYIGYLPQDVELFAGTVRDNIARLGPADDAAVLRAAQMAGVHDMILRLPQGYETEIGDAGVRLSGGARQRIGLARALYGEPRLLVLDEPNSNLDREGEAALVAALRQQRARGVTLIVIAHRPNLLAHVDRILVLREGTVDVLGGREQVLGLLRERATQLVAGQGVGGGNVRPFPGDAGEAG